MKNYNRDFTISPVTNQGSKLKRLQFRDKISGMYLYQKNVSRAFIAKLYHEQRITHAIDGIPVVDI